MLVFGVYMVFFILYFKLMLLFRILDNLFNNIRIYDKSRIVCFMVFIEILVGYFFR